MEKIFQYGQKEFEHKMVGIFPELQEAYTNVEGVSEIPEEEREKTVDVMKLVFLYVKELSKKYWNTRTLLRQIYHIASTGEYRYLLAVGTSKGEQLPENFTVDVKKMIIAARWLEYYYRIFEQEYQSEKLTQSIERLLKKIQNLKNPQKRISNNVRVLGDESIPFPVRLYKYTEKYVIGQPELKKLALAIHRYVNLGIRDVVMVKGPTGSGKNYAVEIMSQFEGLQDKMTVLTWDLSSITPSGFNGGNIEDIIAAFGKKCMMEGKSGNRGIIILNECDKLMQPNTDSHGEDVNAITQQQLLTILEGKNTIRGVDTGNIMFILLGAFGRIDDMVNERKQKNCFGFGKEESIITNDCNRQANLRNDIIKQGAQRELVGRISTILELRRLERDDIKRILLHPETGIIHKKKREFESSGMELVFTEEAIERIAEEIYKENLGARSVVNIVNELVDKYQFDMYECGYTQMIIHEGMFERGEPPKYEGKEIYEKVVHAV